MAAHAHARHMHTHMLAVDGSLTSCSHRNMPLLSTTSTALHCTVSFHTVPGPVLCHEFLAVHAMALVCWALVKRPFTDYAIEII